jgi:flagellar hook-associated protein 1 FlgK
MGSTFSGLNIASSGLSAARAGLDVTGQNIANINTQGYTRQRVNQVSTPAPAQTGFLTNPITSGGQGTQVTGIARLGDLFLDSRVRVASSQSGFYGVRANALVTLEDSFNEPGDKGLAHQLGAFWTSWQDLSNHPGELASGSVVLESGNVLAAQIATGYSAVQSQWSEGRSRADSLATDLNNAADQVAGLNRAIQERTAAGGSINELLDQRSQLTQSIAQIAGGTVVEKPDGTVDVTIGGNLLVSGLDVNHVRVTGAQSLEGAAGAPVQLEWQQRPGQPIGLDGGELAGTLSLIAPANGTGNGGVLAETAAAYNKLATTLAAQVNAIHSASSTQDGRTGLNFFSLAAGTPAALGLSVVPTSVKDIAASGSAGGPLDGSAADAISQLGSKTGSPDSIWSDTVSKVGVISKSDQQQSVLADTSLKNASTAQSATASVDLDEENMNMITQQRAYQAAARVLTSVDEMLDTLINKTGLVGR